MVNFFKNFFSFGFKDGLSHWIWQRITAIIMMFLLAWVIISLQNLIGNEENHAFHNQTFHDTFYQWLIDPVNSILFITLFIVLIHHSTLGMLNIFEDYVQSQKRKKVFSILLKITSFFIIFISIFSVWHIYSKTI